MATLDDVARRAGVSTATASRIINGSSKPVSAALRDRVEAAVADLHYVPNAHARQLARSERTAVGVVVHDVSDPYFAEITRGLQRVATTDGRLVIICNTYRDPARELDYVELLRAHQVAAMVLAGSGYHDAGFARALRGKLRAYELTGGRVAVIGRHDRTGDAVVPDNEAGGYLAGEHLYALGHRDVGVIAGPRNLTTTTDRLTGVRRAARSHHRPPPKVAYADFDRDSGARATADLLAAHPRLTAIAALNDSMAVGALAHLRGVDRRISVIGFDDMPIARDVTPALTTIRLPLADMGALAMSLALSPPSPHPRVERVPAELIARESTFPLDATLSVRP
ncbi:LacI family DNA-binding transcriptional regulator [Asanoa iriomotensis]|uniref:LacI family DNA-binding transcriptional regulator n=1 Tax=Asanoa iriomotensis TaxID=234613 RepID=UPI001943BF92|nr:LacI family DNA-binding transcriptional regulator [Asanoa iriomotensis]